MNTCQWHVHNTLRWHGEAVAEEVRNLSRRIYRRWRKGHAPSLQ